MGHEIRYKRRPFQKRPNGRYQKAVPPVPDGTSRPLWSVMIPTYNCAHYLRETLCSVLAQDPGPKMMQIEVVDDCSTADDPEAVVNEIGRERVGFYRQPQNVGHARNFDSCLARSRGHLVHILHGDDAVQPGFYERMAQPFERHPELGAAFCRDIRIDGQSNWLSISGLLQQQSGVLANWLEQIGSGQCLQASAMVVRRQTYEHLGGFDRRIQAYGEDWEMWVRIAANYPVWYCVEPLVKYRLHTASLSGSAQKTGLHGEDIRRVMEINRENLPPERVEFITQQAHRNFAVACLRRANRILDGGRDTGVWVQVREALRTSQAPEIWAKTLFVGLRWFLMRLTTRWKRHD